MILMKLRITSSRQVGNETVGSVKASLMLTFQNSDANFALIHHQDIALLRKVRRMTSRDVICLDFHVVWR